MSKRLIFIFFFLYELSLVSFNKMSFGPKKPQGLRSFSSQDDLRKVLEAQKKHDCLTKNCLVKGGQLACAAVCSFLSSCVESLTACVK